MFIHETREPLATEISQNADMVNTKSAGTHDADTRSGGAGELLMVGDTVHAFS